MNLDKSDSIAKVCGSRGIQLAGRIPYDDDVTRCLVERKVLIENSDGPAAERVRRLWNYIQAI